MLSRAWNTARGGEPNIIRSLRASGDLTVSLVAERSARIIGHVAFSPVSAGNSEELWYWLGPITVEPLLQREGIGRALVNAGLDALRAGGAAGCALVGDPTIYGRFGFVTGALTYEGVDGSLVQHIMLNRLTPPNGKLVLLPAFDHA